MKSVTVVTRTKNRPAMLDRALLDISKQTFKDFAWIVVNDGGDSAPVKATVDKSKGLGIDATLIDHPAETAANAGICQSQSEFVILHDDDDTWNPLFLEKTVGFLRSADGARYGGVATRSNLVLEKRVGGQYVMVSTRIHNPDLNAIHFADMCRGYLFTSIAFLYRQKFFEKIGGYEPFIGHDDWIFSLKFMMHGDIGFIPEPLANYHLRVDATSTDEANTTSREYLQAEHEAIIRHRFLREDLKSGKIGLGILLHLGRSQQDMSDVVHRESEYFFITNYLKRKLGLKKD